MAIIVKPGTPTVGFFSFTPNAITAGRACPHVLYDKNCRLERKTVKKPTR